MGRQQPITSDTKTKINATLLNAVQLESAVHAGGGEVGGVLAESDSGRRRRVVVEHLQLLPLAAQIDSHI